MTILQFPRQREQRPMTYADKELLHRISGALEFLMTAMCDGYPAGFTNEEWEWFLNGKPNYWDCRRIRERARCGGIGTGETLLPIKAPVKPAKRGGQKPLNHVSLLSYQVWHSMALADMDYMRRTPAYYQDWNPMIIGLNRPWILYYQRSDLCFS